MLLCMSADLIHAYQINAYTLIFKLGAKETYLHMHT